MQKMVKTGFRGERKGNPHPVHILSYPETSPKERGECGDGKLKETSPQPPPKGECSDGKGGREIRELGNLKMRKWVMWGLGHR